jgi:hypothetical protein
MLEEAYERQEEKVAYIDDEMRAVPSNESEA